MRGYWVSLLLFLIVAACGPRDVIPEAPVRPVATAPAPADDESIAAEEAAALAEAQPVFAKFCAHCHTSAGAKANQEKLEHFDIDRYPFGGEHASEAGEAVRKVLGVTGEKPKMPADAPGSVEGADLAAIVRWSHAFDRAHAAGLHRHEGQGEHGHGGH